jgi:hypothetical protein
MAQRIVLFLHIAPTPASKVGGSTNERRAREVSGDKLAIRGRCAAIGPRRASISVGHAGDGALRRPAGAGHATPSAAVAREAAREAVGLARGTVVAAERSSDRGILRTPWWRGAAHATASTVVVAALALPATRSGAGAASYARNVGRAGAGAAVAVGCAHLATLPAATGGSAAMRSVARGRAHPRATLAAVFAHLAELAAAWLSVSRGAGVELSAASDAARIDAAGGRTTIGTRPTHLALGATRLQERAVPRALAAAGADATAAVVVFQALFTGRATASRGKARAAIATVGAAIGGGRAGAAARRASERSAHPRRVGGRTAPQ